MKRLRRLGSRALGCEPNVAAARRDGGAVDGPLLAEMKRERRLGSSRSDEDGSEEDDDDELGASLSTVIRGRRRPGCSAGVDGPLLAEMKRERRLGCPVEDSSTSA